jgi:tyrosyl-DNA phosphodiesterase 2
MREYETVLFVGDMNFDPSFRENSYTPSDFIDVWSVLKPDDPGYTEDTNVNTMRLHFSGKKCQWRYDRIFIRSQLWVPCDVTLIGDQMIDGKQDVFVSDHFGVCARFEWNDFE